MALIDTLIGIGVVLVFVWVIWNGLKRKNPGLGEKMEDFSPTKLWEDEKPIPPIKEERRQIWTDNRSMI
jgi:hypothetical protein